ncbi:MAG: hypothetical protein HUK22_06515 [Thermoguttaceae bacterium]|nr:hypothetical protein [Thermoguttaceae bacterium]
MAWQDLNAKLRGVPLWKALGGTNEPLKVGLAFDRFIEQDEFFAELKRVADEHYARLTLKFRPGWDVQALNFARIDSPSWLQLQVDVEGDLDFDKHADTIYRMDDFFLNCVEQPLTPKDYVAHAMMKNTLRTPICLDESIESFADAEMAIDLEACSQFCLKSGRVGGIGEARKIAEFAESQGIGCYSGFDLQSSIGYRFAVALGATSNMTLPLDYIRLDEILIDDLCAPLLAVEKTFPADDKKPERVFRVVELWEEPGIGTEPIPEILEKYTLDKFEMAR